MHAPSLILEAFADVIVPFLSNAGFSLLIAYYLYRWAYWSLLTISFLSLPFTSIGAIYYFKLLFFTASICLIYVILQYSSWAYLEIFIYLAVFSAHIPILICLKGSVNPSYVRQSINVLSPCPTPFLAYN